jgi:hypothetical protein
MHPQGLAWLLLCGAFRDPGRSLWGTSSLTGQTVVSPISCALGVSEEPRRIRAERGHVT